MQKTIRIEKNVALPPPQVGRPPTYPFAAMEIGDSFLMRIEAKDRVREAAQAWRRRHEGWNYRTRIEADGIRVWRIA
jgi:hypothetical protein